MKVPSQLLPLLLSPGSRTDFVAALRRTTALLEQGSSHLPVDECAEPVAAAGSEGAPYHQ